MIWENNRIVKGRKSIFHIQSSNVVSLPLVFLIENITANPTPFFFLHFQSNQLSQSVTFSVNPWDQSKKKNHFKCEQLQKEKQDEDNAASDALNSMNSFIVFSGSINLDCPFSECMVFLIWLQFCFTNMLSIWTFYDSFQKYVLIYICSLWWKWWAHRMRISKKLPLGA